MLVDFLAGVVDGFEGGAGEFELAAGLKRDIAKAAGVGERDDRLALVDALPAEAVTQAFEQATDRARAIIGNRTEGIGEEGKFFVLGANAPILAGFRTGGEIVDELGLGLDGGTRLGRVGGWSAQSLSPGCR